MVLGKATRKPRFLVKPEIRRLRQEKKQNPNQLGIKFVVPDFDFSNVDMENITCSRSQPDGATCQPSDSRQIDHEAMEITEQNVQNNEYFAKRPKNIISAACQGDLTALLELVSLEKAKHQNHEKSSILQNQLNAALLQAITGCHSKMVAALLDLGANIETYNNWYPATLSAVNINCEEIVDLFIERGFRFDNPNYKDNTVIHCATRIGNSSILKKLLALNQVDINAVVENSGATAIHIAAQYDRDDCLKILIESGADIQIPDKRGMTALHSAAIRGSCAIVKRLLLSGADVSALDDQNKTPWFYAMNYSHKKITEMFEHYVSEDDYKRILPNGKTFLHIAAESSNPSTVKFFIEKGCDVMKLDTNGDTPLSCCVRSNLLLPDAIKLLLLHSSKDCINSRNHADESLLSIALTCEPFHAFRSNIASLLIDAGADVNAIYNGGNTLLMKYFECQVKREFLLKRGANINIITPQGSNALWVAVNLNASSEIGELLESNVVDVRLANSINQEQNTSAFTESLRNGQIDTAKLLYYAGCSTSGLQTWMETEQGKWVLSQNTNVKNFVDHILRTGHANNPVSLWDQARQSVMAMLGCSRVEDKVKSLGLPVGVSELINPKSYASWRKFEDQLDTEE